MLDHLRACAPQTIVRAAALAVLHSALCGCTASDPMAEPRRVYSEGRYQQANEMVAALVEDEGDGGDVHVYQLEQGVTELATCDPDGALAAWRAARDRLRALNGRDFAETVGAWLSDDTALDYEGAAYERILVRSMLLCAELIAEGRSFGGDVAAYANQVVLEGEDVLDELRAERSELDGRSIAGSDARFKLVAFGAYMVAALQEFEPTAYDAALRQMRRVLEIEPDRPWLQDELERMEAGHRVAEGNGVVHVLALTGRGPFRIEQDVHASRQALTLAAVILTFLQHTLPSALPDGVPIDELAFHGDNPAAVAVAAGGVEQGATRTVTDVEEIARLEFESTYDYRVARAVVRRAVKIGLTEAARQGANAALDDSDTETKLWVDAGLLVAGWVWQATEVADLRCWSLLPAKCQALRFELPPGVHRIAVQPQAGGAPAGSVTEIDVRVRAGRPSWVLALAPSLGAPPVLLSAESVEPELTTTPDPTASQRP